MAQIQGVVSQKEFAQAAFASFAGDISYLSEQNIDQLVKICNASQFQIGQKVDNVSEYQALLSCAQRRIQFLRQNKLQDQIKIAASQITCRRLIITMILSVIITAFFIFVELTSDWSWWGYVILGVLYLVVLPVVLVINWRLVIMLEEKQAEAMLKQIHEKTELVMN